ncbi:hypothetical protein A2714_02435 [Candidatus Woesebacteria bacterium RIFCSPHIGHO2_01_FULL_38_9]|uniref:Uncharacterized protein n=2 Tax=Candidatus Woeseibacteriota TaxID=1752722 RepID=A0A1F7XZW9_9BACT|nr:MAG: hypothetical protein A2714_02435 [Candidatus Woesebacteria bacterium RIFCSPHIGHO2_01_FULL_38_9]OGM59058.1 MAG: hypothetical protein A3A75_05310 [Candidatus Woesebacteria bacterium RIFCSPLOWO2_01_FULL_39_10]
MGFKEILKGRDWEQKSWSERLARLSKIFDIGTVFLVLVAGGMAPALANAVLSGSVITYAGAEMYDSHKQRKKKK